MSVSGNSYGVPGTWKPVDVGNVIPQSYYDENGGEIAGNAWDKYGGDGAVIGNKVNLTCLASSSR